MTQCQNLASDRDIGAYWEREFCRMAALNGSVLTPHQLRKEGAAAAYYIKDGERRKLILPDITLWSAPGEHYEIKHKAPNAYGSFGLETYRFDSLVAFSEITQQPVYYAIHNHALAGGRDCQDNHIEHWQAASVNDLLSADSLEYPGWSWVNGEKTRVQIKYWKETCFAPLATVWNTTVA